MTDGIESWPGVNWPCSGLSLPGRSHQGGDGGLGGAGGTPERRTPLSSLTTGVLFSFLLCNLQSTRRGSLELRFLWERPGREGRWA